MGEALEGQPRAAQRPEAVPGEARPDHRRAHRRAREGERRPQGGVGAREARRFRGEGDWARPRDRGDPERRRRGVAHPSQAEAIAAIAKPQGGAPARAEAGQKPEAQAKPSKKDILGIEDKKERMAAIAANIDLFK